jgi:hypothetical protein
MQDNTDPPHFPCASQNAIAANMLLWDLPESKDFEGRQKVARLKALLERVAVQQVESSVAREASVSKREQLRHQLQTHAASEPVTKPDLPPIQQRVGDGDMQHIINACHRAHEEEKAARERRQNDIKDVLTPDFGSGQHGPILWAELWIGL